MSAPLKTVWAKRIPLILGLDTETTGVDLHHGAQPFFCSMSFYGHDPFYYQWDVDPETRRVQADPADLQEIANYVNEASTIVIQNSRFDIRGLSKVGIRNFPWLKVRDTLFAAHLLRNNQSHKLDTLCAVYLQKSIADFESKLKQCTQDARKLAKKEFPTWRLAQEGLADMPSVKGSSKRDEDKPWKNDTWLPRMLAKELKYDADHPWWTVLEEYALMDAYVLPHLYLAMKEELKRLDLWSIYLERCKLPHVVYDMENGGITASEGRMNELWVEYDKEATRQHKVCVKLTGGRIEKLPVNGRSNALEDVVFGHFGLTTTKKTASGKMSMDKFVLDDWILTLPQKSAAWRFISGLRDYRRYRTALGYIDSYQEFWQPMRDENWYIMYPSLNPCGTDTLRWASYNPNEQQISKQDIMGRKGFNLRYGFGPVDDREWWSLDYDNLELRIPGYECEEPAMLELFERPNDPPYYGSYHLLIFSILHPDKYDHDDPDGLVKAKDLYKSTWYQWTKNGNFAELYGAMESSGTADRAFHVPGAQRTVAKKLKQKTALNQKYIDMARKTGYVETLPDIEVNPRRGYPLYCTRSAYGDILPTVPLNYHVQGTACWIMMRAMLKIQKYLDKLNRKLGLTGEAAYRMIMNVHDEVVFDFPKKPNKGNEHIVKDIQAIMAGVGDCVGIKLTVGIDYHPHCWSLSA